MRLLKSTLVLVLATFIISPLASAHVVVKPAEVLTGSFQTFTMGVPNEKDNPVTKLKLDIPAGLAYVSPTVKPGWTITTEQTGEGESAVVKSITWEGGNIDAGFRDDFTFAAKVPDNATDINWKVYQTYQDGVTVSWDQKPTAEESDDDSAPVGPYSITSVKTKLVSAPAAATSNDSNDMPTYLSVAALVVAVVAFALATRKSKA